MPCKVTAINLNCNNFYFSLKSYGNSVTKDRVINLLGDMMEMLLALFLPQSSQREKRGGSQSFAKSLMSFRKFYFAALRLCVKNQPDAKPLRTSL
ncbi:hypothetical protein BC343_28960 [Mucilaginibacter pedocola]|uniref:Uncharacterized protein n=1 Tax=Mucilaginibacter pedocola TaxID=1792845 RepID=A0A1S9PE09_9SPHI|nr:hypothetical protein BC343_28960 [Mucilaginibacter pedocola]